MEVFVELTQKFFQGLSVGREHVLLDVKQQGRKKRKM
jgi:hypothetical protein